MSLIGQQITPEHKTVIIKRAASELQIKTKILWCMELIRSKHS